MNNRFEAIYARQSVDRVDSISIESQIELCLHEVGGDNYKIYQDKGYSGKNIDRPAFQDLLSDIKEGKIKRVIVYRLDRISRSVLDFANVIETFQKYGVEFNSTMEKFDTSSPIGKAMLMIVMTFAQLERETIQQRVIDAYASRSKKGFYMGGKIPYGYSLKPTKIEGIKTGMYNPIPEERQIIELIFEMYSNPQTSFGDVMRYLENQNIKNRHNKNFNRSRLRDIVTNPVYAKSDLKIYDFYKSQGTNIVNEPEDFIGTNGAYLYSGADSKKRKTVSLQGHTLVLAPHEGFIDSDIWIKCRSKCLNNRQVASPIKAKNSYLAGKIKCSKCGYALTAKSYPRKTKKDTRYYICTNKYSSFACEGTGALSADDVDEIVFNEMVKKLREFETLQKTKDDSCNLQLTKLKISIQQIDDEINLLVNKIAHATDATMEYINKRINCLEQERIIINEEITKILTNEGNAKNLDEISNYLDNWDKIEFSEKITVVDALIEVIHADKEKISIKWKI